MRLIDYFDRGADLYPERHCLHDGVQGWTYRDVRAQTHRVANGLLAAGMATAAAAQSTLPITPAQVAAVVKLVDDGKLSNKLARQVIEGVLAGEGEPEAVMTARGLAVVRDDSLIQSAVDEALAANPDVAEKIRGGKVQAAGAIVGAVMKATKGQADAARVRELVLAACAE